MPWNSKIIAAPTTAQPPKFDNGTPKYIPPSGYQKICPRNHREPRSANGSTTMSRKTKKTTASTATGRD
jgi:hypothetical protein